MKQTFISIILLIGCLYSINAQEKNFLDQPYIEVRGEAKKEIVPDEIYINIVINEVDNKGKVSVEQQEQTMLKALSELGVDLKKDLFVRDLSSNLKRYWIKNNDIRTQKSYQLKVNTAALAGQVFVKLEAIGISNLSIERVDHSQIEQYRREVKINAAKDAREKASDLANAVGQTIGKAVFMQESSSNDAYPYQRLYKTTAMISGTSLSEVVPDMDFEKIVLEYKIFARFILE